jgi:hypothetical protein
MRVTILATALTATVLTLVASASLAQQQRMTRQAMNERMAELKTRHGPTFNQCEALAVSRGYRASDDEFDGPAIMHFIEGCIMGQQR